MSYIKHNAKVMYIKKRLVTKKYYKQILNIINQLINKNSSKGENVLKKQHDYKLKIKNAVTITNWNLKIKEQKTQTNSKLNKNKI